MCLACHHPTLGLLFVFATKPICASGTHDLEIAVRTISDSDCHHAGPTQINFAFVVGLRVLVRLIIPQLRRVEPEEPSLPAIPMAFALLLQPLSKLQVRDLINTHHG
jgi:hypothetical protein